jgi:hypothetical protein
MEERHRGKVFELGPDGYGYLLDAADLSRSYPFHVSMMAAEQQPLLAEGCAVSFVLAGEVPSQLRIEGSAYLAAGA